MLMQDGILAAAAAAAAGGCTPSGGNADVSGRGAAKAGANSAGTQRCCESSTSCFVFGGVTQDCMYAG